MSDELTPEERKAIDSLPRERMPAGLEGRVVDAMRDHGFLAKRRRLIMLTNTRAAGVLAAGVALIVGAYSFGLHRGGAEDARRVLTKLGVPPSSSVAPNENDELGRVQQAPAADAVKPESKQLESQEARQLGALEKDRSRANDAPATNEPLSVPLSSPSALRSDESKKDLDWQLKPKEEKRADAQKTVEAPLQDEAPRLARTPAREPDGTTAPTPSAALAPMVSTTLFIDRGPIIVEAPGTIRVTKDEQGKAILIYTSDGVIRIRLGD